MFNYFRNA